MRRKLFGSGKISREKLVEFFDTKGFYLVLALCLVVVGVTAYFLSTGNTELDNYDIPNDYVQENNMDPNYWTEEEDAESNEVISGDVQQDNDVETPVNQDETPEYPENDLDESGLEESDLGESDISYITTDNVEVSAQALQFVMPVSGEFILDYAMDSHIYSKTMRDWRTHSGVDIAASKGTPVKVVADGVIRDIKEDPRFGIVIVVEHSDRVKTLYANLGSKSMAAPNQKVKKGDVISSVGTTAIFESADPPHLHFEVLIDDKPVDPKQYIK